MTTSIKSSALQLILLAFALGAVGCATPAYFSSPGLRFESPEVAGRWGGGAIEVAYSRPIYIVTVSDITQVPPDSSGSTITRDPSSLVDDINFLEPIQNTFRLGLWTQFEASVDFNLGAASFYRLKWQFLGDSRKDRKSGLVAAITGGLASGGRSQELGSGGSTYKSEVTYMGSDYGLILGYRFNPSFLMYINGTQVNYDAETKIEHSPATMYKYEQDGTQILGILGLRTDFKWGGFVVAEWGYSKTEWSTVADPLEIGIGGAQFGWGW